MAEEAGCVWRGRLRMLGRAAVDQHADIGPFWCWDDCARPGKEVGANVLFFGCRDPKHDFLYDDEFKSYVESGDLELYTAFSRSQVRCRCQRRQHRSAAACAKLNRFDPGLRRARRRVLLVSVVNGGRSTRCTCSIGLPNTSSAYTTFCNRAATSTSAGAWDDPLRCDAGQVGARRY